MTPPKDSAPKVDTMLLDGTTVAHFQDVSDCRENGCIFVAPEVMKKAKSMNMEPSFHRKFTEQEIKSNW